MSHRPPGGIDRAQLETIAGIPNEMPDAIAKVKEEGERPPNSKKNPIQERINSCTVV